MTLTLQCDTVYKTKPYNLHNASAEYLVSFVARYWYYYLLMTQNAKAEYINKLTTNNIYTIKLQFLLLSHIETTHNRQTA